MENQTQTQTDADELADVESLTDQRENLLSLVADHADKIASAIARVTGGEYGKYSFSVDGGVWVIKHEGKAAEYLRFEPDDEGASDVYVVSSKSDPDDVVALVQALEHYPALITSVNEWVDRQERTLSDVETELADLSVDADVDAVVDSRDNVVDAIREVADRLASAILDVKDGGYGTMSSTVDGDKWELKWDGSSAEWLRIGGRRGDYIVSGKSKPSPQTLAKHAHNLPQFVANVEGRLESQELDWRVEITDVTEAAEDGGDES